MCYFCAMHSSRYFINRYADFTGSIGDCSYVRELISRLLSQIEKKCPPTSHENMDGGLYVGLAGIGYALYHVADSGLFPEHRQQLLIKALQYLKIPQAQANRVSPHSNGGIGAAFLLGHAGVYAVSALVYNALGLHEEKEQSYKKFLEMHNICKPVNFFPHGSDELLIGRSGYLCTVLELNRKLKPKIVPNEVTFPLIDSMLQSGIQYVRHHKTNSPLMYSYYNTEYLGAAHGLCSILQMILSFPEYFKDRKDIKSLMVNSVAFVLSQEQPNGNYPAAVDEPRDSSNELVHWCHGAPGVIYLLAKAYLTWKDEKYLKAALRCGEVVWEKGLLRKGPGICHGVAGNGYVFLLLYRLTRDQKHLYRAYKFADFMQTEEFQKGARTPDCPYSLYEGLAGTVCFYTDLLLPDKAAFPFFDVFS
ncbi:lanC-like protein 3 [Actinia tenebrosa]|uniref:LanC-like protein 3 n=1 Tax=Actinia tenebrosa TaxID=6105 RepID=A0A6P8HBQ8_ACTTE|nr:lanC-like protein 3 [Actinia tenebrosa]